MYSRKDPLSYFQGLEMGIFGFPQKEAGAKSVKMATLRRCHSLPFVMHISGAKFEEHCFNISRDIVDCVLYCSSGNINDVITFLICTIQKRKYLHNEKRYSKKKKKKPFFFALKSLSNKQQLFFTS